ncbi:WD40 repeat-like protein [Leucogyrophana mollusca]|uniref:WD40 repeat-like protein n=1 Tax=Leucogyrophana mollusca TaxID=85980 RepID=A0ACB8AVX6_9AGAM|nr:WD40 repeat-like protein [Leucogyrophana mollusca]
MPEIIPPRLLWTFKGHTRLLNSLAFSEDCHLLASGADDGHVFIWSVISGERLEDLSTKEGPVTVLRWFCDNQMPDARFIVVGTASGTIQLWKRQTARFTESDTEIQDIAVQEVSKLLAVASRGRVSLLKVDTRAAFPFKRILSDPLVPLPPKKALARAVHFYNSGKFLMVGFLDSKEIVAWEVSSWKELWRWKLSTRIGDTAWSPETNLLLVWNLVDGIDTYHIGEHPVWVHKFPVRIKRNVVKQVELGRHGQMAISGSDSSEIFLWNVQTGAQEHILIHGSESDLVQIITYHSPQDNWHYIASASSNACDNRPVMKVWALHPERRRTSPEPQKQGQPASKPHPHQTLPSPGKHCRWILWFPIVLVSVIIVLASFYLHARIKRPI